MTPAYISELTKWLADEADRTPYGELTVTVRLHEGRGPIVEKTRTERERLTGPAGGEHEHDTRKH